MGKLGQVPCSSAPADYYGPRTGSTLSLSLDSHPASEHLWMFPGFLSLLSVSLPRASSRVWWPHSEADNAQPHIVGSSFNEPLGLTLTRHATFESRTIRLPLCATKPSLRQPAALMVMGCFVHQPGLVSSYFRHVQLPPPPPWTTNFGVSNGRLSPWQQHISASPGKSACSVP